MNSFFFLKQASIAEAVSYARNLHTLKLQVQWIPSGGASAGRTKFTLQDAMNMMLPQSNSDVEDKDKDKETPIKESRLRVIGIGSVLYIVSCFPFYSSV